MKLRANAKINLILDITGVKKNGYHSLFTIMQSVSIGDIVTVEKKAGEEITVSCDVPGIPTDSSNIVYKCADKFFKYAGINENKGVHIHIEKKSPFGAGMGGGSADGAAVLVALNKLFGTDYPEKVLCRIGVKVGADIPFCIVGGTALCLDTGAIVAPLNDIEGYYIVVVKPECSISTKEAYGAVDALGYIKHPKNYEMLELLNEAETDNALKLCSNVFEQALDVPGRVDIKAVCNKNGAIAACMTGSGSAVYGIFKDIASAEKSAEELKKQFENVYICTPQGDGIEIIEE